MVIAIVAIAAVAVTIPFYLTSTGGHSTALPAGCVKPAGGFLIVASDLGFNDSENYFGKGSWPIVNVTQGSTVNITVCDAGNYAHGFQISSYYRAPW